MRIGKMYFRVEIQERTTTQDTFGDALQTWATIATVWGSDEQTGGSEPQQGDQQRAARTGVVGIRRRFDVTPRHRLKIGERVLNIDSVNDPTGELRELRITYTEEA